MPLHTSIVGSTTEPLLVTCDARWLMSYAAGIGLDDERHIDGTRPGGLVAHPLFPVGPEWALITSPVGHHDDGVTPLERMRGVHAGHHLDAHRGIRADEDVTLTGTIVGVESTRAGARVTQRFDAVGSESEPVWTTWMHSVYRGVEVIGDDVPVADGPTRPTLPAAEPPLTRAVDVAATAALVYTECARIWNPIHTDVGFARAAGLPDPILHGTASLALGISVALDLLEASPEAVTAVGGAFRAMVPMPTTLTIELVAKGPHGRGTAASFRVTRPDGHAAVDEGYVLLS